MSEDDLDELKNLRIETEAFNAAWKRLTDENANLRKALTPFADAHAAYLKYLADATRRGDYAYLVEWLANVCDHEAVYSNYEAAVEALRGGQS